MIRTIKLEIVKPTSETWNESGPTLRLLASATPKLLRAAYDARIAGAVCGRDALKAAVAAPGSRAMSQEGIARQACSREADRLQAWGRRKNTPYSSLDVPGAMITAITRAASQAFTRRDQGRVSFESERVLVKKEVTSLRRDARDVLLTVKLRCKGSVVFLVEHSWGPHRQTLDAIARGEIAHGACQISYDKRRKKWFAHLSYDAPDAAPVTVDPARALIVHRGVRSALYCLPTTGATRRPLSGAKYIAQRRQLQARMRDARSIGPAELGTGAKGHGQERRHEHMGALLGKLGRATKTFCQQAAAWLDAEAERLGCGLIVIEDYGGIEPNDDATLRRVLDRFPLYELKVAILHAAAKSGRTLREVPSAYISSTCPKCENADTRQHNTRTDVFHCRACDFDRQADWVAAYWMGKRSGVDMSAIDAALRREKELAAAAKGV